MQEKMDEILGMVDKVGAYIADKLQVPTEKAMEILTKQCRYDLVMGIIWMVLPIVLLGVWCFVFNKYAKKRCVDDTESDPTVIIAFSIVAFAVLVGWVLGVVTHYTPIVVQILVNPEWYMAEKLIDLLK